MTKTHKIAAITALLLSLFPSIARAQVPVVLSPVAHQQFLDVNGKPLAGGFVYTYQAGTTTPQATYLDSQGLFQNSNPIVLDTGGFATIWITPNSYKFCVANSSNVQQWCQDNISNPQIFASLSFTSGGAFLGTLFQTNTANRTYTFPDFSGTVALLNFPQLWTATQQFQSLQFGSGGFFGIATNNNTATRTYTFPDLSGQPALFSTSSLPNVALFQETNTALRTYVLPDASGSICVAGVSTLGCGGTVCTVFAPVVANTGASTPMQSCNIPANFLVPGSMVEIDEIGVWTAVGAAQDFEFDTALGGGTICRAELGPTASANQTWNVVVKYFVLTAGPTGTANMSCEVFSNMNVLTGATVLSGSGPQLQVGTPTIAVNTTISNAVQMTMTIAGFNAGSSVTQQGLKVAVF